MQIKVLSISLVLVGLSCLIASIFPTRRICVTIKQQSLGWKILGAFIIFFIIGYVAFCYTLLKGPVTFVEFVVSTILFGGGIFVAIVVRLSLLSYMKMKRNAELERHRAVHDELTGLPNRSLLHEHIDQAILKAKRDSDTIAILLMDLDRFKEINDTLGHFYGDYLLQLIAPRLRGAIRESDMVARFGGDEFAILLPGVGLEGAVQVSEKIFDAIKEPFRIEGHDLKVDTSIGIALYPNHGKESEMLLQHADVAMYVAKNCEEKYAIYDVEHDENSLTRLMLTADLREAIKKNQLVLHYQPKVSTTGNQVHGVEALVRWCHPNHDDLIPPDNFISIAEETGLINPLTLWVLDNAFAQMGEWKKAGLIIPMSVNLSVRNLHNLDFPRQVEELLDKWHIDDPSLVTLEITESSMILNPTRSQDTIMKLHSLGLLLSIDDFGTGYSSLALLKNMPAGELKIDKSFVIDMLNNENDLVIVRSTIELANNMGFKVVAEGVENKKILDKLEMLGCEVVQGYHLCPPLPPAELDDKIHVVDGKKMLK